MKSVVYKATVTTNQPKLKRKTYYGMTGGTFKKRYYGHKSDIEHKDKYGTTLSRYIWKLKDIKSNMSENAKKGFKWDLNGKTCLLGAKYDNLKKNLPHHTGGHSCSLVHHTRVYQRVAT